MSKILKAMQAAHAVLTKVVGTDDKVPELVLNEIDGRYFLVKVLERHGAFTSMTRLILKAQDQESAEHYLSTVMMRNWKFGKAGAFNRSHENTYHYHKMTVVMKECRELSPVLAQWMITDEVLNVVDAMPVE